MGWSGGDRANGVPCRIGGGAKTWRVVFALAGDRVPLAFTAGLVGYPVRSMLWSVLIRSSFLGDVHDDCWSKISCYTERRRRYRDIGGLCQRFHGIVTKIGGEHGGLESIASPIVFANGLRFRQRHAGRYDAAKAVISLAGPIRQLNPTSAQAPRSKGKAQLGGRRQVPGVTPNNTDTSHPERQFLRRGARLEALPHAGKWRVSAGGSRQGGPGAGAVLIRRPSVLRLWGLGDTPAEGSLR